MDRPRITPELIVGVAIVAFIGITVVRPWGEEVGGSPSVPPGSSVAATADTRSTAPPPTLGGGPQTVPGEIVTIVSMAGTPVAPVVDGDAIWYQTGGGSLSRLDAASLAVDRIVLAESAFPGEVDLTASGGDVWLTGAADRSISQIDPRNGRIIQEVSLDPDGPYALDRVFGLVRGANMLWVIGAVRFVEQDGGSQPAGSPCCDNLDTSELFRVQLGSTWTAYDVHQIDGARSIAVAFGSVWVLQSPRESPASAILVRRDPSTGVATGTTVLPDPGSGDSCGRCLSGVRAGADSLWLALTDRGIVLRINPAFSLITEQIVLPGSVADLAIGPDGSVWVVGAHAPGPDCHASDGFLARIDPERNIVSGELAIDCPVSVAVSRGDVWVGTDPPDGAQVVQVRPGS